MNDGTNKTRVDTLVTSDWHLGSTLCKTHSIEQMLSHFDFKRLILNGDIFDDANLKTINNAHFDVLKLVNEISKRGAEVIWTRGNHDERLADIISAFVGADLMRDYRLQYGGKDYLVIHGDQFDMFFKKYRLTSRIGTDIYWFIQYTLSFIGLGRLADSVCRFLKRQAKSYTNAKRVIAEGALEYARLSGAPYIICGHTHYVEHLTDGRGTHYYNSGCATEDPISCLTIGERGILLHKFDPTGLLETTRPPQ